MNNIKFGSHIFSWKEQRRLFKEQNSAEENSVFSKVSA